LHIGHYFSIIQPGREGADVLVANYHAPEEQDTEYSVELLRRFGVTNIVQQKEVFQPELYFQLLSLAGFGDLSRMTQFKSADEESRTGHLLTYPVLMTHDVAGYAEVQVGEDQRQHLEFARRLLRRYNRRFKQNLRVPVARIVVGRVKDLRHPAEKMSKSSPDGCLFLDDSPEEIRKKVRRATMNAEGTENISFLYKHFVGVPLPESNSEIKEQLAEALIETFS
jgi:tryptophanyl-tRNA synthetase